MKNLIFIALALSLFIIVSLQEQKIKTLRTELNKITNENIDWNNHVVRMQRIAGVKDPDSTFTWIEKVKHPINTKKLLRWKPKRD